MIIGDILERTSQSSKQKAFGFTHTCIPTLCTFTSCQLGFCHEANWKVWDNSVTNKEEGIGGALWWIRLKRYFMFFVSDVCFYGGRAHPCCSSRPADGPPLANVMEKGKHFIATSLSLSPSVRPLSSFVPLWRLTLDIVFTYLTMDERKEGWVEEGFLGPFGVHR